MPYVSLETGKSTTKELVVVPYGYELGILVNARTGKATNRWEDGTAGISESQRRDAEGEIDAYDPETFEQYKWENK